MKAALLLIDLQEYFHDYDRDIFDKKIIPNTIKLLHTARKTNINIIHIITRYNENKSDWPEVFKHRENIWCIKGTKAVKIIKGLGPKTGEILIIKKRFSGFYKTKLNRVLKELKTDTIFIAGYAADVCVRFTTMDAYNEGHKLYWLADCMDSAFENFKQSLAYIKKLTNLVDISNKELYKLISQSKLFAHPVRHS